MSQGAQPPLGALVKSALQHTVVDHAHNRAALLVRVLQQLPHRPRRQRVRRHQTHHAVLLWPPPRRLARHCVPVVQLTVVRERRAPLAPAQLRICHWLCLSLAAAAACSCARCWPFHWHLLRHCAHCYLKEVGVVSPAAHGLGDVERQPPLHDLVSARGGATGGWRTRCLARGKQRIRLGGVIREHCARGISSKQHNNNDRRAHFACFGEAHYLCPRALSSASAEVEPALQSLPRQVHGCGVKFASSLGCRVTSVVCQQTGRPGCRGCNARWVSGASSQQPAHEPHSNKPATHSSCRPRRGIVARGLAVRPHREELFCAGAAQ